MPSTATTRRTVPPAKCTLESPGRHFCQIHQTEHALVDAVGRFARAGLMRGERVLLVTPENRQEAASRWLRSRGVDIADAVADERLCFDTPLRLLSEFVEDDVLDKDAYREALSRSFSASGRTRFYADVSDSLWHSGDPQLAIELEHVCNEFVDDFDVFVFCTYLQDALDPDSYRPELEDICRAHCHIPWTPDDEHLRDVVDAATCEVLGMPLTATLNHSGNDAEWWMRLPLARRSLAWLGENMPSAQHHVLDVARSRAT